MSRNIEIDDRELVQLRIDLREAPGRIQRGSRKTTNRAAEVVDKAMVRDARGHRYLRSFPRNISHEMIDDWTAEIGYNRSRGLQGALVWIILNGSIHNGPIWDKYAALRRSTPAIMELYASLAEDETLGTKQA